MTLTVRLEKLKFLAREMQLAIHLSKCAPTDAEARMLVRHVLIRAENFIAHARKLRKPLTSAGFKTRDFHETKEFYASQFDEYFKVSRDRLGAHVQDLDFGKRIDLWNDIEASKSGFFAEGAVEIYRGLEALAIPGYVPYAELVELSDPAFREALGAYRASGSSVLQVEIGSDPLAMTRPNSTAMINTTPVHQRSSQIALIHRWMRAQADLLNRFSAFPDAIRILKARAITDLVSCCDCLITRSVPAGAPQEMDGLDKLLIAENVTPNPINAFKAAFGVEAAIAPYRDIRNKLGGHLEEDPSIPLSVLLQAIDQADMSAALSLYYTLRNVFEKACRGTLFLISYLADGQTLYGVLGTSGGASVVPFDTGAEGRTVAEAERPPETDAEFAAELEEWLSGPPEGRGRIRSMFYQASFSSPELDQFVWTETFAGGSGQRTETNSFRTVHRFLVDRLRSETDEARVRGILDLMVECGNGDPAGLTEVLLRFIADAASAPYHALIAHCFGDLAKWNNEQVRAFLMEGLNSTFPLWISCRIALFKMFVRSEGLTRINQKAVTETYGDALDILTDGLNDDGRLLCQLVFASQFCDRKLSTYFKPFEPDFRNLKDNIVGLATALATADKKTEVEQSVRQLLDTYDFVGVALVAMDAVSGSPREAFGRDLVGLACDGVIVAASHDQSLRNLCLAYMRLDLFEHARSVADGLADRNPDQVRHQILRAQIIQSIPGGLDEAKLFAAEIELRYVLSDDERDLIEQIKLATPAAADAFPA